MRTLSGTIIFAVSTPTTAIVYREGKEEASLGYGLGLSPSNEPEALARTIPVCARSGRVFFREANEGEINPTKCFVVPMRFKIAASADNYAIYPTDVKSIVILDFSNAKYRYVAFHDTVNGHIKVIDLNNPDQAGIDCPTIDAYDLTLCGISDEELSALPVPNWNDRAYDFSPADFTAIE